MKRILFFSFIFTILMLAVFFLFFRGRKGGGKRRDLGYYNDLLYRMTEDYLAGADDKTLEERYGCRIIRLEERIGGLENPELGELYADHALVLDFVPGGEYAGKVAWNDWQEGLEKANKAVDRRSRFLWMTVLIAGYLLLGLLYWKVFRPEHEMERFSSEIAKGNLDVPLPIRKDNMFGNLTESFDLMREELLAAREREMEAEKKKKEMALSLAHDIRTPVTAIRTACEMVELLSDKQEEEKGADPLAENIRSKVRIIDAKAETISRLADNMLHVSLEEIEHIKVEPLEESAGLVEEYFQRLEGMGSMILENRMPGCLIWMDRLRMEQVIDNIVGNSRKYAGTEIRIRFDELSPQDGQRFIRIAVRDAGPGVPEEELPLITEKYYRGSNTRGKSGAGLGMYLSRYYMEKQGGGMEYYNDHGFVVELLLKKV